MGTTMRPDLTGKYEPPPPDTECDLCGLPLYDDAPAQHGAPTFSPVVQGIPYKPTGEWVHDACADQRGF